MCPDDRKAIDGQLVSLPRRLAAVAAALLPGQSEPSERVTISTHVHAALPARVDSLSLVGPGGDVPSTLHPLMRHWSTTRKVAVTVLRDGQWSTVEVMMTDWFQEAVLGADGRARMVPDDQVGIVPPREWLDMQVRRWRAYFGHHVPSRTLLPRHRGYIPPVYLTLLRTTGGDQVVAFLAAVHAAADPGAHARMAYRGLLDPVLEVEQRRGEPPAEQAMHWDIDYLRTWLDKACAEDALDIGGFAAQLAALHAEISRVLGETPDHTRLGRCPAFLAELDDAGEPTGRKKPCGGALMAESFAAQAVCPRCRTPWDVRGSAGAGTAREIRRVWPVDRYRRYKIEEIDRITPPRCPTCQQRVRIQWRDVTGTRDAQRTWQPAGASCATGCDEARRSV